MADIGAHGCVLATLLLAIFGFNQWHTLPSVVAMIARATEQHGPAYNLYFAVLAGGCAFGLYRRWLWAAYASFAVYALVLLFDVVFPTHQQSFQEYIGWLATVALLAAWLSSLVAGLRGCRALAALGESAASAP